MRKYGSHEMSVAPNNLLLNGKVLLTQSLSSGNIHPMHQIYQYGFPFPILPNLNSLPEKAVGTDMGGAVCSPSTPVTLDKNKRIQDPLPRVVIDLVDGTVIDRNIQGSEMQPTSEEVSGLSFSNPMMQSRVVSFQHQENGDIVIPPEGVLHEPETGKRGNQVIDLNKTPEQKARRKKHRPKVTREDKPARKPGTPKPVTPKPAMDKESRSKRKYVRKKRTLDCSDTLSSPLGGDVCLDNGSGTKSVRRCLNFDSELPDKYGCQGPSFIFAHNAETQAQDACIPGTVISSSAKQDMSSIRGQQVVEKQSERFTFDLNSSTSQLPNEFITIPKTPAPSSQPSRRETMRLNHMNGYLGATTKAPMRTQHSRREFIRENLKRFAWKNVFQTGNSDITLETAKKNLLESNNTTDGLLRGTKRDHNLVNGECFPSQQNFIHAYNRINRISENPDTSRHGSYFPESNKRTRTEQGHNEITSNTSFLVKNTPSSSLRTSLVVPSNSEMFSFADAERLTTTSWKMSLPVPNNSEGFTFADAQRLMTLEKLRVSKHMLSFDQGDMMTRKVPTVPVQSNNLTSLSMIRVCNNLSAPVKPSGFPNTDCRKLSTPDKTYGCNDRQETENFRPQTCTETLNVNDHVKKKTKRSTAKEHTHVVKPMPPKPNRMCLQEDEAASSSHGSWDGKKFVQVTALSSGNFQDRNSCLHLGSLRNYQSSSNFKEPTRGIPLSGPVVPHGYSVDDIVRKLKGLSLNGGHEILTSEVQNALVPYGGVSVVVPYEGPFDLTKKRRPRVKVDLDPETNRVWNVLMGKESSNEKVDMDKEKWWEKERHVFRGRVDSFIARMHLIQGDRRFSRWKGSVVDSVVGVFLTQNVSDHLSSSAFMALAARFPLRSNGDHSKPDAVKVSRSTELRDSCIVQFDDNIKCSENKLSQELGHEGSFLYSEHEHNAAKGTTNNTDSLECNTRGGIVDYSNWKGFNVSEREIKIGHESRNSSSGTPVTVTGPTSIAETEDRTSLEDVVSSQNSDISSQSSSEYLVQTTDQVQMSSSSNFDAGNLTYEGTSNRLDNSTSFLELLHMSETTRFQGPYSHPDRKISPTESCGWVEQLACLEVDKRTYASNHFRNTHHHLTGMSYTPSPSYDLNSKLSPVGDITAEREGNRSHSFSNASGLNTTNTTEIMGQCGSLSENSVKVSGQHDFMGVSCTPSQSFQLQNSPSSQMTEVGHVNASRGESPSHLPLAPLGTNTANNDQIMGRRCSLPVETLTESIGQHSFTGLPLFPSPSYQLHSFSSSRLMSNGDDGAVRDERSSRFPSASSENNIEKTDRRPGASAENSTRVTSGTELVRDFNPQISKHPMQPITCSETEVYAEKNSFYRWNFTGGKAEGSGRNTPSKCSHLQDEQTSRLQQTQRGVESQARGNEHPVRTQAQIQSGGTSQTSLNSHNNLRETLEVVEAVELNLNTEAYSSQHVSTATANITSKTNKVKPRIIKDTSDWDNLRKQACHDGARKERSTDTLDSLDWEAVRSADVNEISQTIRERGMNNMLAERIKEFLDRIVKDHGSIDLEWLRDVPPDSAKDYLLSIRGLGLKSVECVRLLTLHHLAFPVDTNVGRICVRLGWVPLQPLPESLQLHLLEMYPILETIQKYIWPRLCKLDQRTLYELHYQLITFGKVFCTKSKPNCNACPMRGECKHFASAFASARLALPGPEEKGLVSSTVPISFETDHTSEFLSMPFLQLKGNTFSQEGSGLNNREPIIEEPASPGPDLPRTLESEIEDAFYEDPDEIPTIKLNIEKFAENVQNYMQENNMELQIGDLSKALVAITPDTASIPTPKLKNVSRLRTEHRVYELPDSHPLLEGMDQREPDDPCSYLLAIWSPGETAQSTELPQFSCNSQDTGKLCENKTCFRCNSIREAQAQTVRGTLLIPCRTAMRGSFPLNGTYFQVNEVFADHESSCNPINIPRDWIWNLHRRTVYFGTSVPSIFKGLTTEGIQHCFWRGFVCVRGFDRIARSPKPLYARLHFPASKLVRNKKDAAAASAREEE